ncbi:MULTISPECIES: biotin--[acetyl-CoA-carboxylase] ligase [Ramlibacter]|uniref:biotin--[acetyl-CoA-carboxylase] ligase n=1 Tax=Ramlibacter TaxID=174951 RepID=UPI00257D40DF|nr:MULTISPECIES: biotin--[acetyl-CoA-carboxylase] ligase [Ramlibacter]
MNPLRETLLQAVSPLLPGFAVEVADEIDSTNSELMRRARAGDTAPVLLAALSQTAGRGRLGRSWASAPGDSLTFSLGLPLAPRDWSGLSLVVGLSLAESLHPRIRLKWPNDLWLDGRKLAGILIETASFPPQSARYAVVGIGINLRRPDADGLSTPPAGLEELLPGLTAAAALARVAPPLVASVKAFESAGFEPFRPAFEARDALRGLRLRLSDGTEGTGAGVSQDGGLLVHTATGPACITSSEVSVRPAS